jgi:hypothetical protein
MCRPYNEGPAGSLIWINRASGGSRRDPGHEPRRMAASGRATTAILGISAPGRSTSPISAPLSDCCVTSGRSQHNPGYGVAFRLSGGATGRTISVRESRGEIATEALQSAGPVPCPGLAPEPVVALCLPPDGI